MAATSNEEQPFLPPHHGSSSRPQEVGNPYCLCLCLTFILAIFASLIVWTWYTTEDTTPPEYTVAITSVSGLDHPSSDTKQGGVLINPAFKLTVGIASRSKSRGACIDPHTIVKVSYSYLHLPLAAGSVPSICVGPLESSDLRHVVAKGSNVAVPGFLFDTLAEEMEAIFEVKLNAYRDKWDDWSNVLTRWVVLGDAAACPGAAVHAVGYLSSLMHQRAVQEHAAVVQESRELLGRLSVTCAAVEDYHR